MVDGNEAEIIEDISYLSEVLRRFLFYFLTVKLCLNNALLLSQLVWHILNNNITIAYASMRVQGPNVLCHNIYITVEYIAMLCFYWDLFPLCIIPVILISSVHSTPDY